MKEMSHFSNTNSILSMKNKSIGSSFMDSNEKCLNNQYKSNQYEIPLKQYVSQQQLFRWRQNTHHPILRITAVNQLIQKQSVVIKCEKIVHRMDEIRVMKIEEIIYSMSQMLLGYQSLLMRLGWVCVEGKMVGVNQKGELLLWVNQNPVKNTPGGVKLMNEKDIVNKITQILQPKCPLSSNIFFEQIKHLPKTFRSYLDYLVQFKLTHKLKIVPKINVIVGSNNINIHNNNNNNTINKVTETSRQQQKKQALNANNQKRDLQQQLKLQSSPLITSTSVNYIPTISNGGGEARQQLFTSFGNNTHQEFRTMHNINNSQSQSQFIGIKHLHSVHSLFPLPVANHQPHQYQYEQKQRKASKTTSIIFNAQNNVNTSTIISQQNYNNGLMNNNNNAVNNIIEQQKYQQNQQQQQSVKSLSKINFSYSQKRNDNLYTPRQSTFLREYTSDRRLPALGRIQSQTNQQIREFTLMDDNNKKDVSNNHLQKMTKSANDIKKSAMSSNNNGNNNKINKKKGSRSIVPSYTISYNPITDSIILQNEIQLKKSSISSLSQKTIKSQQQYQQIDQNMIELTSRCPNKSSMTTNHRSATSNQYQSMDSKCSNVGINYKNNSITRNNSTNNDLKELDILNRRNMNMFASNSSHRVSYSIVKDSFVVENDTLMKNTKSILVNTSQQLGDNNNNNSFSQHNNRQFIGEKSLMNPNIKSTLTTSLFAKQPIKNTMMNNSQERFQQQQLNANNNNNNNNSMYTFGGLIIPNVQDNVSTNNNNNKDTPLQLKANKNINNNGYANYTNANNQRQQLQQQKQLFDNKKLTNLSPTIIASSTIVENYQLQKTNHHHHHVHNHIEQQSKIKLSTTSVKSIQQLYKNINAKSEKKSIIVVSNNNSNNNSNVKDNSYNLSQCQQKHIQRQQQQQENYNIHLSPVAKHQSPVTPIKQSHIINYNNNISGNTNNNSISLMNNNNHFKKNHLQYLLSPTTNNHTNHHDLKHSQQLQTSQIIQQSQQHSQYQQKQSQQQFDYNQWRGITGLLNQSNVHQLKQSIHCGPEIRAAPLNIKLQLLDKFGREIGHSILPATQNNGLMMPGTQNNGFTNSCVRSIFIDEQ